MTTNDIGDGTMIPKFPSEGTKQTVKESASVSPPTKDGLTQNQREFKILLISVIIGALVGFLCGVLFEWGITKIVMH